MNILIDIPKLNKANGGVYQYSVTLLKVLANANLSHQFYILCNNPASDINMIVEESSNFHFTKVKLPLFSLFKNLRLKFFNVLFRILRINKKILKKDLYDCIISEYGIDIIHTPVQYLIKKKNVKSITTMHDVQELHFPEFFSSAERAYRASHYKIVIDSADAIIVSYDHVKSDLAKYFDKPKNKIYTVLLDMQDLWFQKLTNKNIAVLLKFNLPTNFLLYPASSWEHKNHLQLIKAIKLLNNPEIHLVCTGHPTEYYTKKIKPFIESEGLTNKIQFIGIVADEELYSLYHNCRAVVIPTLYEAGSFPLMESIFMGIPVICSNVTSLPETIGDDKFIFDPNNVDDIAKKINKIWSDDFFRKECVALSLKQVEKLKNNNAALKINAIYETIIQQ